jgi:S-formylglutathione hydrolase
MSASELQRFEVSDERHGAVPCAALIPSHAKRPLPGCLFLFGGGGSRESLADIQPLLESFWASGVLPQMLVATPDPGAFSFYLDDPKRGQSWETFVAERFVEQLRARFHRELEPTPLGLVGVSMGGYGALKIALSRPTAFAAVAAISPMIEPAFEAARVPLRNRYHYPADVPQALLGPDRDPELYERDHPITRAACNAEALRAGSLGIYLDASGADALHAHDGAEHLHRVLWELDIAHEYRLRRDADHIGPEILERLREAFAWVGTHLARPLAPPLSAAEQQWSDWLASDRRVPPPPPLPPTSPLFPALLRAQLEPLRAAAAAQDPTFGRRYGLLPDRSF